MMNSHSWNGVDFNELIDRANQRGLKMKLAIIALSTAALIASAPAATNW
jgi:hypothetical protein